MSIALDIYIDQGADFVGIFPAVTTSGGSVLNLTTYTAMAQMRRSYASSDAVAFTVTISNPTGGIITLNLASSETQGLAPTRYVYDVNIISNTGVITRVFEGIVTVNPGVTNKPITNLVVPYLPDDYSGDDL